ncbi:MAG: HepT-like ribonuclease domain-containing protein [Planctomycetota bacterium]
MKQGSPSMPPKEMKHLHDVIESADAIAEYVSEMDYETYMRHTLTRDGVERRFIVIGEALVRLKRDAPALHSQIEHIEAIHAFRNIVVHVYDSLNPAIVWKVIQDDLPILRKQAQAILDSLEPT